MKKTLALTGILLFLVFNVQSQVIKRLGDRAKNKLERKAGDKVDKVIDDATDGKSKPGQKKEK